MQLPAFLIAVLKVELDPKSSAGSYRCTCWISPRLFFTRYLSKFPLHHWTAALRLADAPESLSPIHGNESLRGDSVVRRTCFETHGVETLSASSIHSGVDQLCGDATPPVFVVDSEICNENFAGAGLVDVHRSGNLTTSLDGGPDLMTLTTEWNWWLHRIPAAGGSILDGIRGAT